MFDSHLLIELDGLGYQIGVELVEPLVEEGREVARQLISFLKAGSQSVSKSSNIWHMYVF